MGNTHDACIECLKGIPGYKLQFDKIFGKLDIDTVGQAIASFERAIVTGPSPYDYYERLRPFEKQDLDDIKADPELNAKYEQVLADAKAHPMSDGAKRGRELYFTDKANCSACHVGANLTDEKYHNIGIGMDKPSPDIGREEYSNDPKDKGAFKTPTIRNVALSAPYMHDGGLKTLEEVVEWYAKGGHPNPALSDKIKKLNLTDQDKQDLVEFMKACTGEFPKVARDRIPQ
jgi:cytochrome c peroxidase